ncbi:sigma factor-like helix-turn-helix DNA-binding protein [Streptomyces sp. NBC_01264]|uniref:sigma factor-like helix-turn-helix DNA-binding protein n=1 Tax=Streptomyces sp. NBC_01264 TaxID=2903804 RepID=UPI00225BC35A|nr:sigma factor-like helix-turn-helix DNA-binding protein [Streptomyces sp. NBC_01264]MCX4780654.1 RNA polymerase [Streptomyces sp. NBC_01264]
MDHGPGPYAEFEAFVAGAAGRLLRVAILLTAEPATPAAEASATAGAPAARALLATALARTYANWRRLRGDDPYDHTRQELCAAFAHTGRRHHGGSGVLGRLTPLERLVVVLRLYEGVAEEVTAAQLGLTPERVRTLCDRAVARLRAAPAATTGSGPDPRHREAA